MATDPEPSTDNSKGTLPAPLSYDEAERVVDPVERRTYIEIRPAETPIEPGAATRAMATFDRLLRDNARTGVLHRVRGTTVVPTLEWLLVSDGCPDPAIRYLVGSNVPHLVEDIDGTLRSCFPDTYEFAPVQWHPDSVIESHPFPKGGTRSADASRSPSALYVAGVEYRAIARRRRDWQTPLTRFDEFTGVGEVPQPTPGPVTRRLPLDAIVETMANAGLPVCFQVVVHPYRDWTGHAHNYLRDLEDGTVTLVDKLWDTLSPRDHPDRSQVRQPASDRDRMAGITARDPRRTLMVSARAAVLTWDRPARADDVARRLTTALTPLSGPFHEVVGRLVTDDEPGSGTHLPGTAVFDAIRSQTPSTAAYARAGDWIRRRPYESRGIVADLTELPGFCLVDGAGLTPKGRRALAARPTERTGLPLPPPELLAHFAPPGMALGMPLTHDRRSSGNSLYLPAADQDRHVIAIGPTGSGKSVLMETAMLSNVDATDGPDILLDYKGGGTASEYLQAHYRTYGSLDGVHYFDCTRVLPALSVLDIRPLLAANIPREEARSRIAGHYAEMLAALMGAERYGQAVEAPKVIRNHLRALFDPVHGTDAVSHADLFEALLRTLRDNATPAVADDRLAEYFASLLERDRDVFNRVLGGALNRVETIATDGRLAPVFDHVPAEDDPHFDFAEVVNEDVVIIFDFGGMEPSAKRGLTLAILSNLWRALQARTQDPETPPDPPLVNCYLEEAGAIADSAILDILLAQGRSFGLSLFLGVQFLGQLDSADPTSRTAEEALNETATIIAGQVSVRDDLVHALATDAMPPAAVNQRLSRMPRGEWLVRPGIAFGADSVRPFLIESLPAPPGHPASDEPLDDGGIERFEAAFDAIRKRTARNHGLEQAGALPVEANDTERAPADTPEAVEPIAPVDHCYAHTNRMTWTVAYDGGADAVLCLTCGNRYDSDIGGLIRAIECHSSLDEVDRDDVPIGDLKLKLSPGEREERGLSDAQFRLLQAVYNAMQERFHPLEYDLTRDSMLRLQEYTGIEGDAVTDLIDEGLLSKDTDHPHRLYTVTPDGRKAIGESYREGLDYGHGEGDLEESSQHILGVILGEQFLEMEYASDPDSTVERVQRYHDIGGNQRLDVAGLDSSDDVVIAVEVERVNHDVRRAAPEDFDKMAACEPDEAIWIAMSHSEAHEILAALREPLDGEPRTGKEYSRSTPVQQFVLDEPGLTKMYTVDQIRKLVGAG